MKGKKHESQVELLQFWQFSGQGSHLRMTLFFLNPSGQSGMQFPLNSKNPVTQSMHWNRLAEEQLLQLLLSAHQ
jgi:hypothetical protein